MERKFIHLYECCRAEHILFQYGEGALSDVILPSDVLLYHATERDIQEEMYLNCGRAAAMHHLCTKVLCTDYNVLHFFSVHSEIFIPEECKEKVD